jgi:hypothetical protein
MKEQDYPVFICFDCGTRYGRGMPPGHICTVHEGVCEICGARASVTEPRDFGHLCKDWRAMAKADRKAAKGGGI